MFSQLQLYGIILYVEPAVTQPTQFRHYEMQNTGLCEQMNALLPGAALDRATVQNGARNQEQLDICYSHGFICWHYIRGVRHTSMWRSFTGWKMTDFSREHGALVLKGTNAPD